ncbi:uncharacterized protein PFL1_04586 [Pseudozyma flocculosa PF-1]|uniref:Rho-GAP domain-containing protein n=1 Tax=Pseudozyma flocculosa PF-1 TaxID=1277687 RepID=A0A061HB72_9BASI|nr:uncharacterized protein PFL1_04586 [Pseudozyma flocculosa PF-1]EPQ27841.1 hypothetical protein PFL1_04586 [Pseudozyma flocculosa PF-1]
MHRSDSPEPPANGTGHSTPDTPPSQYRTATATLSAAFASLWGSYQQQQPQQPNHRSQAGSSTITGNAPGPTPSSPRAGGGRGRTRGAIPFAISAPLEASPREPTASPKQRSAGLRSVFDVPEDLATGGHPDRRAAKDDLSLGHPPSSPRASGSGHAANAASAAYSTLSRLRTKPSRSGLNLGGGGGGGGGSGFLWGTGAAASSSDAGPLQTPKAASDWESLMQKQERLDSHVRRIVFQAGLDYETRPMVVLAACCLPDPKEVDYDDLFDRIIATLDLFAENDYTVIYLASGGRHRPGWNWLWKSYKRLGRKFRKNLKRLYIVHPTFFTRSLMQFIQTGAYFVSPKFPKKVTTVYTLSELARHIPLTQIDIPPAVLQVNAGLEASVTLPEVAAAHGGGGTGDGAPSKVFGVDLVELMGEQGEKGGVPKVVRDCVEAILGSVGDVRPIEVEGIFRRSPSSALLRAAQESYDRGHPVNLSNYGDPHVPAVLLKVFLRSLPRPIFPASLYSTIAACPPPPYAIATNGRGEDAVDGDDDEDIDGSAAAKQQAAALETIQHIREVLLPAIEPPSAAMLLSYVLGMLHRVSQHADVNKMDAANLATVIAPNLVSGGNAIQDMMLCRVEGIRSMAAFAPSSGSPSPRLGPPAADAGPSQPQPPSPLLQPPPSRQRKKAPPTTLGTVIRFCIERYYEIFDEAEFGPRLERAQQMVDEFGSLPTSASHRRHGSAASSSTSGLSQPNSPFGLAFTPSRSRPSAPMVQADAETPSTHLSQSITSRGEHRGVGTLGRNSAGSLRLTKRSLRTVNGSGLHSSGSGSGGGGGGGNSNGSNGYGSHAGGAGPRDDDLTGALSGVAITGANAAGLFSSPVAASWSARGSSSSGGSGDVGTGSVAGTGSEPVTPSSPTSLSSKGSPTLEISALAASATRDGALGGGSDGSDGGGVGKRRSGDARAMRRELSEVREDNEAAAA